MRDQEIIIEAADQGFSSVAVSLTVFSIIVITVFKTETFRWNHIIAFLFIILAVFFAFKK